MLAAAVFALCSLVPAQEPTFAIAPAASQADLYADALATSPFDRVVAIALSAADPTLEGHGPCQWLDYVAEFSGTLHVWTKVEGAFDTFLRVEDGDGKLFAEDDDSGGVPTPYVKLEVEPGAKLSIAVAASKTGETGEVELHLVAAPETESTRAEALHAQQEIAEIKKMREGGDLSNARDRVVALLEHLAHVEDGSESELVAQQVWLSGFETHALSQLGHTESAWRSVFTHRLRTLPQDHSDLQAARSNLAATMSALGDLAGARALLEEVLEAFSRTLPQGHHDLQAARINLAGTIKAQGDLAGARVLEEAVLEVFSRTLPRDHPDFQTAQGNLAVTIKALGDRTGARALEEAVLEVRSRTLPADHPDLQAARQNLAGTIIALGDLAGARALFEQVLEVRLRTLPADHPDLLAAQQNLAVTIKALGDLDGARELEEQVLEVRLRTLPSDHPDLLAAQLNLAGTIQALGDLDGARELEEQVLEVRLRTLPSDHPDLQNARQNLAGTLKAQGDLTAARALEEAVLEVRSRTLPSDHPDLQAARLNYATTIKSLGDLTGARALEEAALEVFSRTLPADHPDLQLARQFLASTLAAMGDLAGARALLEQALEVFSRTLPADHLDLQTARGNLAITLRVLGDLVGAQALEQSVLEVRSRMLPADHPDLQVARGNLAVTIRALGDLAGARALEEAVLQVRSRTLPEDHPALQVARGNLAGTLAREHASETRREQERNGDAKDRKRAFEELTGDFVRSLARSAHEALLSGSIREAEERCANLSTKLGRALSLAEGLGVFERVKELEREVFLASESTRGAPLKSASLARGAALHPRYAELRDEIRSASEELARLAHDGASTNEFDLTRSRREVSERELLGLAKEILGGDAGLLEFDLPGLSAELAENEALVGYRRYPRFRIDADGKESSPESLCAFVVRSDERLDRIELGPIEPIERAVDAWRAAIGLHAIGFSRAIGVVSTTVTDSGSAGDALRGMVLDPLADHLACAKQIVIFLDDVLHLVPLNALPAGGAWIDEAALDGDAPLLLGDLVRIEVRTSVQELLAREPLPPIGNLVVVGGVDYEGRSTSRASDAIVAPVSTSHAAGRAGILRGTPWEEGFSPLMATVVEARGIAALMQSSRVGVGRVELLEGPHATRDSLAARARNSRFLHISTHGWFAPESIRSMLDPEPIGGESGLGLRMDAEERVKGMAPMLLCGLALAGANLPEDELGRAPGLMTAEEISALDLSNCELAVLSACDTNVGVRRAGQGVASLQRALHMAGARSVITSLWKVPDEATKELMLDFYRRIWVMKEPKHEALWAAKKKLRDAVNERGEPMYSTRDWAAWVLTGEQE